MRPSISSRLKRPGVWEKLVVNVRSAWRMYSSCTSLGDGRGRGGHRIRDVDPDARRPYVAGISFARSRLVSRRSLDERQHLAVPRLPQHDRPAALAQVIADDRILLVHARRR